MGTSRTFRGPILGAGLLLLFGAGTGACGRTSFDDDEPDDGGVSGSGGKGGSPTTGGSSSGGKGGAVGKGGSGVIVAGASGEGGEGGDPCMGIEVPGTRAAYDRNAASTADPNSHAFFEFPWP